MPAPMRSWVTVSVSAALLCMGCSNSRLADSTNSSPTLVKLSPSAFIGDVLCLPGSAGALQLYTVELYEVSQEVDGGLAGEALFNTSPPVSCGSAVSFQANGGRRYAADVFGYDQTPAGGVEPRWTASCGRGADGTGPADLSADSSEYGATRASLNTIVPIVGCTYLSELAPGATETSVVVSIAGALGALECGSAPGQVSDFVAVLNGQSQAASCTGVARFTGIALDTPLRIAVSAFSGGSVGGDAGISADAGDASTPVVVADAAAPSDAGADAGDAAVVGPPVVAPAPGDGGADAAVVAPGRVPQWTTECAARAYAGVETSAVCEPLQPVTL